MESSLTRGFVGVTIVAGCWGCRGHDGRVVLIRHRERRDLLQEGLPLVFLAGVFLVCVWHCSLVSTILGSPVSVLTLNGGVGVTRVTPHRSGRSSACGVPDDIPASALSGIINYERGPPNRGRPGPTAAGVVLVKSPMLLEPTSEPWVLMVRCSGPPASRWMVLAPS
jgi:hypothetical protein